MTDVMDAREQGNDPLIMLYVPCGSEAEAASLASKLLKERLIACANVYASRSLYRWEGALADGQEWVMVCKTLASKGEAASVLIKQLHSYDVPCILQIVPAEANEEYYTWARAEVGPSIQEHVT